MAVTSEVDAVEARSADRVTPDRLLGSARVAWALAAVSGVVWLIVQFAFHPFLLDLSVYRAEGFAIRNHVDLYGPIGAPYDLRATYPPFAALAFVPLTLLPLGLCQVLTTSVNLALLATAAHLTARIVTREGTGVHPAVVPLVTAAGIWLEPVSTSLHYGQINLLVLVLVLADFARKDGARGRGVALGIAVALKITPGLFIVYLVLTRRTRFAATAAATFGATVIGSYVVLPAMTVHFWTTALFQTKQVGDAMSTENQSVHGLLTRLLDRPTLGVLGVLATIVVAGLGLACSVGAFRSRGEIWGLCSAAVTALLISPISWSHHWVWCIPVAVLLVSVARRAGVVMQIALVVALLAFYVHGDVSAPITHSQDPDLTVRQQLAAGLYPLLGAAFLILVTSRYLRCPGTTAPTPTVARAD